MINKIFNPFRFRPLMGTRSGDSSTFSTPGASLTTQLNQTIKQVNLQEFAAELRRQIAKH